MKRSMSNSAKSANASDMTGLELKANGDGKRQVGPIRRPSDTATANNSNFDLTTLNNESSAPPSLQANLAWLNSSNFSSLDTVMGGSDILKSYQDMPKSTIGSELSDFNEFRLFGNDNDNQEIKNEMDKLLQSSSSTSGLLSMWSTSSAMRQASNAPVVDTKKPDLVANVNTSPILNNANQAWNSVLLNDFDSSSFMLDSPAISSTSTHSGSANHGVVGNSHQRIIKSIWSTNDENENTENKDIK